jgi:WD40 repeat protein
VILFISVQAVALIDAEKMVQLWRVDTAHSLAVREKAGPYPSNLSHQTTFLPRHSRDEHREALIVKRAFFTHFHTQVRSVSFSPDGKYIASASTVR